MKTYKFKISGKDYEVAVNGIADSIADVTVNGVAYSVEICSDGSPVCAPAAPAAPVQAAPAAPAAPAAKPAAGGTAVKTPLPGVIISVDVKEGQAVKRGQKVAVIEAMKMENEILASCDGTVAAVAVHKGDSVLEGDTIATIA